MDGWICSDCSLQTNKNKIQTLNHLKQLFSSNCRHFSVFFINLKSALQKTSLKGHTLLLVRSFFQIITACERNERVEFGNFKLGSNPSMDVCHLHLLPKF